MFKTITLLTALAAIANASPIVDRHNCKPYTDTFDDITGKTLLPQFSPVTNQNGLTYKGWDAAAESLFGNAGGIIPQSAPNVAVATMVTDLLSLGSITLYPFGTISIKGTSTKKFTLQQFYFGCAINDHTATVPLGAIGCTISVVGYNTDGEQVGVATYGFTPTNALGGNVMTKAVLPDSFVDLVHVTIGIPSSVLTSQSVLSIDNVEHCNH